jgi:N-acetyl-anhydromuramyl-L-alanine amidase AmpD
VYPDAPQIITRLSKHWSDRKGAPIRAIVLHHSAGRNSLPWLTQNPNQVSTHVLIHKNGTIYRMVPDSLAANHVGFSNLGIYAKQDGDPDSANQPTLSIEIENMGNGTDPYTDEQYWSTGFQICQWWNAHGDLCVLTHELIDTAGKRDPYNFDVIRALRCAMAYYDH